MVLRIAIVGVGKIARDQHVPVLVAHPEFQIVATVSPETGLADLPCFASVDALLASGIALDAVSMCQPPQARFAAALTAIEAGKHVFLEKPPCCSLGEVEVLASAATAQRVSLFTSWHSCHAPAVAVAREWLTPRKLMSVDVDWQEDVRVWHPGQDWIWRPGGFGVFDPGINALSIVTAILPRPLLFQAGELSYPENRDTPIAADLIYADTRGVPVRARFDFRQDGLPNWTVRVETDAGLLQLTRGGRELWIDAATVPLALAAEYRCLYDRFADLARRGVSDVDVSPLRHVADAFMGSRRRIVEPFTD